MAGNNIGSRTKQAMTFGANASVYKTAFHQDCHKRTVSRGRSLPVEAPGDRTQMMEVLEHVAVPGGQQQATKHATAVMRRISP